MRATDARREKDRKAEHKEIERKGEGDKQRYVYKEKKRSEMRFSD